MTRVETALENMVEKEKRRLRRKRSVPASVQVRRWQHMLAVGASSSAPAAVKGRITSMTTAASSVAAMA